MKVEKFGIGLVYADLKEIHGGAGYSTGVYAMPPRQVREMRPRDSVYARNANVVFDSVLGHSIP